MRSGLMWLLAVLGASAVAGCTSANQDDPLPTITSTYQPHSQPAISTDPPPISTGANVRPGEKPPTLSPVGKTNTPIGADLFARYWIRTLDWGYATTDSSLAKAIFARSCTGCARFMRQFEDASSAGWHFRGGRLAILGTALQDNDHQYGATSVEDVTVSQEALHVLDGKGKTIDSAAMIANDVSRVWLRWTGRRWTVVNWKQVIVK
jgi:hypothetical protein